MAHREHAKQPKPMDSHEVEDAILDDFSETLSALADVQIRAIVRARVPSVSERTMFEAAAEGVSRDTLILLAAGCLARQTLRTPAAESTAFPAWFGECPMK
jgi:hypothetical protein